MYRVLELKKRKTSVRLLKRIYELAIGERNPEDDLILVVEKIIPVAIKELERISKGEITEEIIKEYFWNRYKEVIGEDKPKWPRELCLVKEGVVEKVWKRDSEKTTK